MSKDSQHFRRHIRAPRASVYNALIDKAMIAQWKVLDDMTCLVHEFDAREGGAFRISLAYEEPTRAGKTTAHTDTYHGRFVSLVPNEQVVEEDRVRDRRSRAARHDDDYSPAHRC